LITHVKYLDKFDCEVANVFVYTSRYARVYGSLQAVSMQLKMLFKVSNKLKYALAAP